jgi:hypothetical protein
MTGADTPDALRAFGGRYRVPLTRGLKGEDLPALLRMHPLPDTWSALEYACHARDVFLVQRERLGPARTEELFTPLPMRREERVTELRYNEQEPAVVAGEIAAAADALADFLDEFTADDWSHEMRYLYPTPQARPLSWVAVHTVHEAEHHLLDVGRVVRAARGR